MYSRPQLWTAVVLMLLTPLLTNASEDSLREALRGPLFEEAADALKRANQAKASVLTPETYREAAELYTRAERAFASGTDVDRIARTLTQATTIFERAASTAPTVQEFVSGAFEARQDALQVDAKSRASKLWVDAEEQLYEAASRAEKGRERGVQKFAENAEGLYRDAELAAIETALFTEIEAQIEIAKDLNANRWSPQSYGRAQAYLDEARKTLAANRYDTDKPRGLANESLHYAYHAQYIARLADDIDDRDTSLEAVLLEWEASISELGEHFDLPMYFDRGPAKVIGQIKASIQARDEDRESLKQALAASETRAQILSEELAAAQSNLRDNEAARARLDQRMAMQERRARTLARVENYFTPEEAVVVRAKNQLIVRLVGLGFTSGSAEVEARHGALLSKLEAALTEFPETPIVIEGHTDSYGVDTDNLALSIKRAESIAAYLLAAMPISSTQVSAVGFGETRPIANNETADGRAKNRRIDVVLYPTW